MLPAALTEERARALPALGKILRYGTHAQPLQHSEPALARYFQMQEPWPWAAMTRAVDAGDAEGWLWLRADPAHWQIGSTGATLAAVGSLGLSAQEADALRRSLAPLFGDHGFELSAPDPARWYLRTLRDTPRVPHWPKPGLALGQDPRGFLSLDGGSTPWQRLLNEAQVILHQHTVNQRRADQRQAVVNSLWFWGGGGLPQVVRTSVTHVLSQRFELIALARAAGVPVLRSWEQMPGQGRCLIDIATVPELAQLETDWIAPAWQALCQRRLSGIEVCFGDGHTGTVRPPPWWRFWQR